MFLSPPIYLSLEYLTGGTGWLRGPGPPHRSRLTHSLSESKLEIKHLHFYIYNACTNNIISMLCNVDIKQLGLRSALYFYSKSDLKSSSHQIE